MKLLRMSKVNIIVEKKKDLFDAFMDLEKVHGRIVERAGPVREEKHLVNCTESYVSGRTYMSEERKVHE